MLCLGFSIALRFTVSQNAVYQLGVCRCLDADFDTLMVLRFNTCCQKWLTFTFRSYSRFDVSWNSPQFQDLFRFINCQSWKRSWSDVWITWSTFQGRFSAWATLTSTLELNLCECQHLSLHQKASWGAFKQRIFLGLNENRTKFILKKKKREIARVCIYCLQTPW